MEKIDRIDREFPCPKKCGRNIKASLYKLAGNSSAAKCRCGSRYKMNGSSRNIFNKSIRDFTKATKKFEEAILAGLDKADIES